MFELRRLYERRIIAAATKFDHSLHIAIEKKRLLEAGVDKEELRLICRALSKMHCEHAERNLKNYQKLLRQVTSIFAPFS